MNFKVGDKVRVICRVFWIDKYFTGKTGIVVEVKEVVVDNFLYTICINGVEIPVYDFEIEKINIKGQQLLFDFMSE